MKGKREEPKSRENSPLSRRTAPLGDPFRLPETVGMSPLYPSSG